jgi:hypothetical protein
VNSPATGSEVVTPCIADVLPALPDELEYRSAGRCCCRVYFFFFEARNVTSASRSSFGRFG